jgi:hypothetical protein
VLFCSLTDNSKTIEQVYIPDKETPEIQLLGGLLGWKPGSEHCNDVSFFELKNHNGSI